VQPSWVDKLIRRMLATYILVRVRTFLQTKILRTFRDCQNVFQDLLRAHEHLTFTKLRANV